MMPKQYKMLMDFDRNFMNVLCNLPLYENFLQKTQIPLQWKLVLKPMPIKSPTDSPKALKLVYTVEEIL